MHEDPLYPYFSALADFLELAESAAREHARQKKFRLRKRVGSTVKPGPETPLWNELIAQVRPLLSRWGDKAHLARTLGIDRQRLNHCVHAQRACLDGERTLLLFCWLVCRKLGRDFAVPTGSPLHVPALPPDPPRRRDGRAK